jgi:hypothetical protein
MLWQLFYNKFLKLIVEVNGKLQEKIQMEAQHAGLVTAREVHSSAE